MPTDTDVLNAFALAIPNFTPSPLPEHGLPRDDPEAAVAWLQQALGEDFCCCVEWKEFDAWGLDSVRNLRPIREANVDLSIDELYDEDGMPLDADEDEPEPSAYFLTPLNRQLLPHGLQLIELHFCEDPRLVCVSTTPAAFRALTSTLRAVGIETPDVV